MFAICGIGHGTWAPRLAEIKAQIGAGEAELGLALLMLGIGAIIAMPISGILTTRFGSRAVSITGAFAHALVFPLMALAWDWISLGVAMMLYGFAVAGLDVAMNVQAAAIERRYGRPIMSSFHGVYSVGDMAGALGTGLAALIILGLGSHFLIAALLLLIIGVGGCRLMIDDRAAAAKHDEPGPRFVLPSGILILIGMIAFAALLAEGSVGDWSAIYLTEYQNADTKTAAMALTVFALAMAVMRFLGDRVTARLGPFNTAAISGSLAATGLAIALLAPSPMMAIAGYGLTGIGLAVLFPVTLSIAPRFGGMSAGASIAAVATLGYGGFLIGPPVIGLLADRTSLPAALSLVVILLGLVPGIALLALRVAKRRAHQAPSPRVSA